MQTKPHDFMHFPQFIAAGEALTDLIVCDQQKTQWTSLVGGSTWNVARAVVSLGVPSAFAGAISKDVFGDALWMANQASGLDSRFLQRVDKAPLLAVVHETQPPSYFFIGDDSADLHFDADALPTGWMKKAKWVHFGGISLARQPLAGKLIALAKSLKEAGVMLSYDPNYRLLMDASYDATLKTMTGLADVIKVSDEDLHGLFHTTDAESAFATLRSWNPTAHFLYSKGAQGASLHINDREWHQAAPQITVIDSVGAGDASIAAFIYSMLEDKQKEPIEHLRFAVSAGACACLKAGANPPSIADIRSMMSSLGA